MIFALELIESPLQKSGWRPSYLRRRVLLAFALSFCAIIGGLETINYFSRVNHGIASSVEKLHYLWTYGPTAIFTVLASLWSRVEYQAKQSAPWQSMVGKHEEADKTVLLDYVSIMQPIALYRALRNKHSVVAEAVTCSMILRLLIVFSTSLFSLQQAEVHLEKVDIQLLDSFSANTSKFDGIGSQPFDIINGVLFEDVSYPRGTTENVTFQQFSAPNLSPGALVTTTVDGMIADIDCETASIDIKQWEVITTWLLGGIGGSAAIQNNQIKTPSCTISKITLDVGNGQIPYVGRFTSRQCDGSDSNRIVVILANVHAGNYSANHTSDNPTASIDSDENSDIRLPSMHIGIGGATWTSRNITLLRSVQVICKPNYSLIKLQATANTSETSSKTRLERVGTQSSALPGLDAWTIADKVIEASEYLLNGNRPIIFHDPWNASVDVFDSTYEIDYALQLGVWLTNMAGDMDLLFQKGILQNVASAYYRAMAAQTMQIGLSRENSSMTTGSAVMNKNRVTMALLPLRVLEGCLGLGVLLAIAMSFRVSTKAVTPWNTSQLSTMAAILNKSSAFRQSLSHTGAASLDVLRDGLRYQRYASQHTPDGFLIDVADGGLKKIAFEPNRKDAMWKPFPNLIVRIVGFIVVALIIAALEITIRVSEKNDGLGGIWQTEDEHDIWRIYPSAVMVTIGLFFGSINFNTKCLSPYARLRKASGATYGQFMTSNFFDSLDIFNIFSSIHTWNFAVAASTLTTLIASFLTIVTSGLYSATELPQQVRTNFSQETSFSPRYNNLTTGASSTLVTDFIVQYNLSFPRWTYEDLAFPELSLNTSDSNMTQDSFIDIKVPALRSAPICRLQKQTDLNPHLNLTATTSSTGTNSHILSLNLLHGACWPSETRSLWTAPSKTSISIQENSIFGQSTTTGCDLVNSTNLRTNNNASTNFIWGELGTSSIKHIWALSCINSVEYVDTWTRFQLPDFAISTTNPPTPDESTADRVDFEVPPPNWDNVVYTSEIPNLDAFFDALVSGQYAIPIHYLGNTGKVEKVVEALKFQYNLGVIQQINSISRVANSALEPLVGNVTTSWSVRLVQDALSTRILEALLGIMLVLGIAGSVLLNTDCVLPKNPCSVAAVASLLADSNFLERFGSLGDPNDELRGGEAIKNARFFIGWLGERVESTFTIYMTGGDEEKSEASASSLEEKGNWI
jgi:hypothetical protein